MVVTVNVRLCVLCFLTLSFQTKSLAQSATATSQQPKDMPSQSQPRVYVADSESWEMIGGWGMSGNRNANGSGSISGAGYTAGGARPQTAEIIKTFNQRCSNVTITNNVQKADFAVILDHEGGKGLVHRRNKIAVFNRDGDVIFSDSTRELGNSVKDACQAILTAPPRPRDSSAASPSAQSPAAQTAAKAENLSQTNSDASTDIKSSPSGADVELDGNFIGNTPSTIGVSPGDHTISVRKKGYKTWERKIKVSSGKVNVFAELEAEVKQNSVEGAATATPASEESKQKTEAAASEHPVLPVALGKATASASSSEIFGAVSFTSDPSGAEVYVDDAFVGKSPITLNLKIGHHYVHMFAKDYKNWSQQFTIVTGPELRLSAVLQKAN
jgi:PEGA domain